MGKKAAFFLTIVALYATNAPASAVACDVVAVRMANPFGEQGVNGVYVRVPNTLDDAGIPDNWKYPVHQGNIYLGTSVSGGVATLVAAPDDREFLTSDPMAWLPANPGDVAGAATVFERPNGDYVINELIGYKNEKSYAERGYSSSAVGEVAYLILAIQDGAQSWEWIDLHRSGIQPDFTPTVYYGWASYTINAQGNLSFLNSAIGLDGQSMAVGLIPEPTAAALMLLGLAPLDLRRRLVASMCAIQECG